MTARTVDLDDTSHCPHGACEICGTKTDVFTGTFDTFLGVYCLRLCPDCSEDCARHGSNVMPAQFAGWKDIFERIYLHCEHLGITADDMADLHQAEKNQRTGGER